MAEGFLRKFSEGKFNVYSAGIEKHGLNPRAVEVMGEIGVDISNHWSKTVNELPEKEFDYVVTVCDNAKESCPVYPAKTKLIHQAFTDPSAFTGDKEETMASYRVCRDAIGLFCQELAGMFHSASN